MSLFAFQLDVSSASIFLFEKAVALRSHWLSQGIAGPGWDGLVSSVQSLQIAAPAARRASRYVKTIQAQTKTVGQWVVGTRKGDMVETLNEQELTWPLIAMLLSLTAVLGSDDVADVLVNLSAEGMKKDGSAVAPGAVVPASKDTSDRKPMSFETAYNIVSATAPYVGSGYEMQEFSKMLRKVLESFDDATSHHLTDACKWRPPPTDIVALLQQVSEARQDPSVRVVVATDKGIDVLCYLAMMLFDCNISISVNGQAKSIHQGQGPYVDMVLLASAQKAAKGSYNYADARMGTPGIKDANQDNQQWRETETRWTLSDYVRLCVTGWALSNEAIEEFNNLVVDRVLAFWNQGHVYGAIASKYTDGLKNTKVEHQYSDQPAAGLPLKALISVDQLTTRIRAFDPSFANIISARLDMENPFWAKKEAAWATIDIHTVAPYCPCFRHKGRLASPGTVGCVATHLDELLRFVAGAMKTTIFLSAPQSSSGIPVNCCLSVQTLVERLPSGRDRSEKLDLAHILESAALLLGNPSTGSLAASKDVIGVHAFGCSIFPNALLTIDFSASANLIFQISPGALYCRGVQVESVRNSAWADTGFLALGGAPVHSENIVVMPANQFEPAVLQTTSSRSEVLVEAALKDNAGYIAFRVTWTLDGKEVSEYMSPCDVLYGMSKVPSAVCTHQSPPASSKSVMLANAAAIIHNEIDAFKFPDFSYAKAQGLEVDDCFGGFDGIVVAGMKDRGHLLRALRYHQDNTKIRMGSACLECAIALANEAGAKVIYAE